MKRTLVLWLLLAASAVNAQQRWMSELVKVNADGTLAYVADAQGNILPDFSGVGYHNNRKALPWPVSKIKIVNPSANDQENLQSAINEVAGWPADAEGHRGVILLKKGVYKIPGNLRINTGGIILRGEGPETKLIAAGKGQRKLIQVSGSGNREQTSERIAITTGYVPVGARSFRVSSTSGLKTGDAVVVFRPATANWLSAIKMDQIDAVAGTIQWKPADYNLEFERRITAIKDNEVFIDQPVVMAMEKQFGGGLIYRYKFTGRISEVGVENMQIISEYSGEEDEDHGWEAVSVNRAQNCWVRNVISENFGYSCVNLGAQSKNITVVGCSFITPKSKVAGGRRYAFNNDGQLNLFLNCFASEGRHDYVTGAKVAGPNVFFNNRTERSKGDIGPHHRWAVGTLYDNIVTDGELNIQDRGNWGTGHGWAGVTQVVWAGSAVKAAIQSPWASGRNYSIGFTATKYNGRLSGRPDGFWEGHNRGGIDPASLYLAQVRDAQPVIETPMIKEAQQVLKKYVLAEAAWALKQEPVTVTAQTSRRSAGGKHDFFSEGDYWWPDSTGADKPYVQRDGMTNPDNFTAHREAMIRFSKIVGALSSAYILTGDKKYVKHAVRHCLAWFTDKETLMNPSLLYAQAIKGRATGRGIGIIDTIQLMEVVQGLMAMRRSGEITIEQYHGFQKWFREYLKWLTTHPYGKDEMNAKNNHGTCWVMQVAVFARFTEDIGLLDFCRNRYKNVLLPDQMAEDGSFPLELKRTKPYGYAIFNLDAMATICQTLSIPADNLWTFTTTDGRSVKKGVEFLHPYLKDKNTWPYAKDVMYWDNWPVAQPSLLFSALNFTNAAWLKTWKDALHDPSEPEVIRNLPVRNPLIWLNL